MIGASTGGPKALQEILTALPGDLPVPVLVVQHMSPGFTAPLATRLDGLCRLRVHEARQGELLERGTVYIAPAGQHTSLFTSPRGAVSLFLSHLPSDNTTSAVYGMPRSCAERGILQKILPLPEIANEVLAAFSPAC